MFITQSARGGTVQHDVFIEDQDVGLIRRLSKEAQLQAPIGPSGGGGDGAGAGQPVDRDAAETEASLAMAPAVNGDDDALGDDVRADLAVRIDGIIDGVLPGAQGDMLIAQRPRRRTVQHDVLVEDEYIGLVRRLGQEAQLQAAIGPLGGGLDDAVSGRIPGANTAEPEAGAALGRATDLYPNDQTVGVRAHFAVGIGGIVHWVLPGPHDDLLIAQPPRGGTVQHDVLLDRQEAPHVGRVGQEVQVQLAIGPSGGGLDGTVKWGGPGPYPAETEAGAALARSADSYPND